MKSGDARVALIGFPSVGKVGVKLYFKFFLKELISKRNSLKG